MKQKNETSAQALETEELKNVNGGHSGNSPIDRIGQDIATGGETINKSTSHVG